MASCALRAAIIFVAGLPFWMFPFGWDTTRLYRLRGRALSWLHHHVFTRAGFDLGLVGDTEARYLLEVALVGALVWLLLDRRRRHEAALYEILQVSTRYVLAGIMLGFGLIKVFPLQMASPSPIDLIRPLGQPDLMWPAWDVAAKVIGASSLYRVYAGCLELLGGGLLLFRRTAVLGTLLVFAEVSTLVAMTSDTVDLGRGRSFNWIGGATLLAAAVLLVGAWRPIVDVLLFDRPTTTPYRPTWPWVRRLEISLGGGVVLSTLLLSLYYHTLLTWLDRRIHSPLAGVYDVERFAVEGGPEQAAADLGETWRVVALNDCSRLVVRTLDDTPLEFAVIQPTAPRGRFHRACRAATAGLEGTLTVKRSDGTTRRGGPVAAPHRLRYAWLAPDHLELAGVLDGAYITVHLRRVPLERFPLLQGGRP